jgi:hypothetical protein
VEPEETHVFPIGSMTLEGKPPVRRDTIFRLASMTKPIGSNWIHEIKHDGLSDQGQERRRRESDR